MVKTNKLQQQALLDRRVAAVLLEQPEIGRHKLAKILGITPETARYSIQRIRRGASPAQVLPPEPNEVTNLPQELAKILLRRAARPSDLATLTGASVPDVEAALVELAKTHTVRHIGECVTLTSEPDAGFLPLSVIDSGGWTTLGLLGDTHLCSTCERLDALHSLYDLYESEGIATVLHAGNIVDGYLPRINGDTVKSPSIDGQCQYVADHYPARKGITTYFVTGDDHEGWWQKDGFNFGSFLTHVLAQNGREDLKYLGHVEADIEFTGPAGQRTMLKLQHPGGGSAYARSYTGQKQIEAFQGGEKPTVLVQGHYHVSNYMVERNVHVISLPGLQDQTVFARKKRLRMEVGGCIFRFKQGAGGEVTRAQVEMIHFFDRGFYRPFLQSDAKLVKGHLCLPVK